VRAGRLYDQRRKTYGDLAELLERQRLLMQRIGHHKDLPAGEPPPQPSEEDWIGLNARVAIAGSPEVQVKFSAVHEAASNFFLAVHEFERVDEEREPRTSSLYPTDGRRRRKPSRRCERPRSRRSTRPSRQCATSWQGCDDDAVRRLVDRRHVLSAVGLAFDLVGAVALTLGLYRHSRYLTPGLARGPDDVAQDAAFGTVGASFLVLGFVLQGLQYFGVTVETSHAWTAAAAGLTILLALLAGWIAFGLIYIAVHRHERNWVDTHRPQVSLPPSRRVAGGRHGWRF
jgi:hypothetical protein